MSWIENIQNDIVITTGEGSEFRPIWKNATKQKQFNFKEYDFPNNDGTLIIRKRPRSKTYNLELYFQGEDHLELAKLFDKASDDPRAWKISHPFYETITVQPSTITFDNKAYNVTQIGVTVRETISTEGVFISVNPQEQILTLSNNAALLVAEDFEFVEIEAAEISSMNTQADLSFGRYNKVNNVQELRNQYNTAKSAIANATAQGSLAMRQVQNLLNFPASFEQSTAVRFDTLRNEFNSLLESVSSIGNFSYFERKYFENQSTAVVSAMCETVVTEPDYKTRTEVFAQAEKIEEVFDQYILKLNEIQNAEGYFPNADVLFVLEGLIRFTVVNLNEIALETQQERKVILERDSDVISLAHRFYGLEAAEENIQQIIDANNISLFEILEVKKGREIVYYV